MDERERVGAGPDPGLVETAEPATDGGPDPIALTFDDGPHPEHTPRLLAVLRQHGVRATFCLWGDHVVARPDLVRAIVADGHLLGNHTTHHADLAGWPADRIRADLRETATAIDRAAPGVPVPYFRAPFGSWGESPQVAVELGMRPLGWSLSVADWTGPPVDELVDRLLAGMRPGGVVLLHDGGGDRSASVAAVARMIPAALDRGHRFGLPAGTG